MRILAIMSNSSNGRVVLNIKNIDRMNVMNLTTTLEIASSIMVSLGGAGVIIISVANYLANRIAIQLEDKYQLKLDKELEQYKANLEQCTYVTKNKFDVELETYRNPTKGIFEFIVTISTTINLTIQASHNMI